LRSVKSPRRRVVVFDVARPTRWEVVLGRNRLAVIIASAKPSLELRDGISTGPGKVDAILQQGCQTTNTVFSSSSLAAEFRRCTLGMDILRAKSPEMVRTELWSCLLLYNLIRESMLSATIGTGRSCRSLSCTATVQMLGNLWLCGAVSGVDESLRELFVSHQLSIRVGHRVGRTEPRANKRRPKILALLTEPRAAAKARREAAA